MSQTLNKIEHGARFRDHGRDMKRPISVTFRAAFTRVSGIGDL
jgi:hypothetical protein